MSTPHLAEDLFGPLGMTDTALWVAEGPSRVLFRDANPQNRPA